MFGILSKDFIFAAVPDGKPSYVNPAISSGN